MISFCTTSHLRNNLQNLRNNLQTKNKHFGWDIVANLTSISSLKLVGAIVFAKREHLWNFSSSVGLKLIVFVLYFATIPFFISHQGTATYGVLAFVIALLGYSTLIDQGLTYTVGLSYVRALSRMDSSPERVIGLALPIYAALALFTLGLAFWHGTTISEAIWRTSDYLYAAWGLGILFSLQILGSLPATVLLSHNRVTLVNLSRLAADVCRIIGLVAAALSNTPMPVALSLFIAGSAVKLLIDVVNCDRLVGLSRLRPRWSLKEARSLFRKAWIMWLVSALSMVGLLYDKWFVTANISAHDYSSYSIANDLTTKIYFLFYALSTALYTPLMRRYAEQKSSLSIYYVYFPTVLILAVAYFLPLCIFSYQILEWYIDKPTAEAGVQVIRIMSGSAVCYLLYNLIESNLYARGLPEFVAPAYIVGILVLLFAMPSLFHLYGMIGVALSVLLMQVSMLACFVSIFVLANKQSDQSKANNRKAANEE